MASMLFRDEQLNYFKFASIVMDQFPKALRQTFKTMWDNKYGHIAGYRPWDDSLLARKLFLANEGGKTKIPTNLSYEDWDCTAMFQATIFAQSFALRDSKGHQRTLNDLYVKPKRILLRGSFHASVVSPGGDNAETVALAIDQLRILRNSLCHSTSSEIDKKTFDNYVQLAKDVFDALGVSTNEIDVVKGLNESDFPTNKIRQLEKNIRNELLADKNFLKEDVKDELRGIKSGIARSKQERKRTETKRKKEFETLTNQLQVGNDEMVEIRKTAKKSFAASIAANRKLDDIIESKELLTGTKVSLPRSCLPPIVPHFTGRQKECEEIVDHMTSESTRLISIWGSPGFGKTSVAIAVGHELQSKGVPVYFLSLRRLQSKADVTSKLLSFFTQPTTTGQTSQRLSLDDELCLLFSKVSDRFVFILDNADELFQSGTPAVKEEVINLLEEILRRNERVRFVLTTRESFEFMNVHFLGHQAVRIGPLDKSFSENLVHELLPNANISDCIRITQICGNVPLAMKLLCSSISEDRRQPSQFLDEIKRDKENNVIETLDSPEYPSDLRIQFLFDSSFQRLSAREKEALVSLSILPESFDQEVAAAVLNENRISTTNKILQGLRKKSLLDLSSKPGSFSMHTLTQSFAREKGEHEMEETVLNSKSRFYALYISLFEKLNKQFLTGHSMSAFVQFYEDKQNIVQSLTEGCVQTEAALADTVCRVLVTAELFLDSLFWNEPETINLIYDSAIESAKHLETNVVYRQLLVSKAFFEITLGAEGRTMHLLSEVNEIQASSSSVVSAEKGKSMFISGICQLFAEKTEKGVQMLKEALCLMKNEPEEIILRLVASQILSIYCRFKKNFSGSFQFYSKALQECKTVGDTRLLIIPAMESAGKKSKVETDLAQTNASTLLNQPIQLEILYLVHEATNNFSDTQIKQSVSHVVLDMLKENEASSQQSSLGLSNFQRNVACMLTDLNKTEDAEKLSQKRIDYHQNSLDNCKTRSEKYPHQEALIEIYLDRGEAHYNQQNYSEAFTSQKHALDIALERFQKENQKTAEIYDLLGITQHTQGNLTSAIQSKRCALDMRLKLLGKEHRSTAASFYSLGVTQHADGNLTLALDSYQNALEIRRKRFGEEHSSTADSYHSLGDIQQELGDMSSARQSFSRAYEIRRKLFGEEHPSAVESYHSLEGAQQEQADMASAL